MRDVAPILEDFLIFVVLESGAVHVEVTEDVVVARRRCRAAGGAKAEAVGQIGFDIGRLQVSILRPAKDKFPFQLIERRPIAGLDGGEERIVLPIQEVTWSVDLATVEILEDVLIDFFREFCLIVRAVWVVLQITEEQDDVMLRVGLGPGGQLLQVLAEVSVPIVNGIVNLPLTLTVADLMNVDFDALTVPRVDLCGEGDRPALSCTSV